MPEGDTIHKLAAYMAPRLSGQRLDRVELAGDPTLDLAGRLVEGVRATGKHLFVDLDGGLQLRTHLGMHGSWHRYRRGEAWKRPARHATLVLETTDDVYVCFHAKEAECILAGGPRAAANRRHLGPDLTIDAEPDLADAVRRARLLIEPHAPVADVLLDQRVTCGIGNVYKSEVLFLGGVHPRRRFDRCTDDKLIESFSTARGLLRANLHGGARRTRPTHLGGSDLWVYGRGTQPCLRCATPIERQPLGRHHRPTYWCPRCQK